MTRSSRLSIGTRVGLHASSAGYSSTWAKALRKQGATESASASPESSRHETKDDLFREAERLGIKGRSRMSKDELRRAIERLK